ncbi:hypothetical protein ACFFNY_25920 [Paenibacillus hodogayensis]|uniref:Uncharacterized protein n=1 Tax=Paenibacillus hodogayensis TaxID=279208 RepID=A0ABV5W371_9BACL
MKRHQRSALHRRARTLMLAFVILCFALTPYAAIAGKEGVYVSGDVYFTLEKVRFSAGSDDSILRFAVGLHNGSANAVDYNYFGVRVTDAAGYSYSAQLSGQQSARVQPGKTQEFAYEARVPKGLQASDLRVALFSWNYGSTVSMTDLGSLSVAAALAEAAQAVPQALVPLAKVDAAMGSGDTVSFRVGNEYYVYENNDWNLYADLLIENTGDAGLTLPAGLKLRLEDGAGQTVSVTTVDGGDKSLLPGKPQRMTIRAALPDAESGGNWSLQFYYLNGTAPIVLDSLAVGRTAKALEIGEARTLTDSQGLETVSVKVESAVVSQSDDGQWVTVKANVANNGAKVVAVPKLTAKLQSSNGGVSVTAEDPAVHTAYLSQNGSESFSFSALMPKGVEVADMQVALFETRSSGTAANSTGTGSNGSSNNGTTSNGSSSNGTNGGTSNSANTGSGTNNTSSNSNSNANSNTTSKTAPVLLANLGKADIYTQGSGTPYKIGSKLALALDKKVDVAVSELKLYDNENNGFSTAVAKLKLTNADTTVLATPDLTLELVDAAGHVYSGTKQVNVPAQMSTNSSYLVSYSFLMSSADPSGPLLLRVYNAKDKGKVPLDTIKTAFQQDDLKSDVWNVYPYQVKLGNQTLFHSVLSTTFSYTLRMDLDLKRNEQIIADANLSKLQFDLLDSTGQVMSTQSIGFLGGTKLVNGMNELTFSNLKLNQFNSTNYVVVYESIETPNGVVKRKLTEFH